MTAFPLQWSVDTKSVPRGTPFVFNYEANPDELAALRKYAEVDDLISFDSGGRVTALPAGRFRVSGIFTADLVQPSVIDLEAVRSRIEEEYSVEYWPEDSLAETEPGNLPWGSDPPERIAGGQIPVGALLSELFVLAIDPYPRNERDHFEWNTGGSGAEISPFAALLRLKDRDGGAAS
jgi:hypothetical protein